MEEEEGGGMVVGGTKQVVMGVEGVAGGRFCVICRHFWSVFWGFMFGKREREREE